MSFPSGPQHQSSASSPADAFSTDDDSDYLPWKIAFRVKFSSEKIGLRFHPAQFPDTGNGIYTIRLLELTKGPDGGGPAQQYNKHLQPGQEHLTLRPGLYLTHINDNHLIEVACEEIIESLQKTPRPITLRFVDVEAGVVTRHELRDSLRLDGEALSAAIAQLPSSQHSSPRRQPASPKATGEHLYKIILLGTAGVGKSSILAIAANGDDAYTARRPPTLEAEFGTIEFPDPSDYTGMKFIKARIWDTAGQERFRAITRSHYRRADGALLVYDVSDAESFTRLGEWLHTLRETAGDSLTSAMVLENKVDKLPATGVRPAKFAHPDKVQSFCESHNLLFVRTSAKHNARVHEWDATKVFDAVRQLVLHIHETRTRPVPTLSKEEEKSDTIDRTESIQLTEAVLPKPKAVDCGGCN
ncbi:Rab11 family GTPase [Phytophthora megakarya]|uniref:Rab11 family GTPase n=1 Tax=Phytophthora megakarya TaxID=4795 RepID=A0A225WWJ0_9STRA|nr:Rab11 family GTPase [Phytophthora megakarya]